MGGTKAQIDWVETGDHPPPELVKRSPYPNILTRYWRAIRTCHVTGARVHDQYNYRWDENTTWEEWEERLTRDIFERQTSHVKINASFWYVLHNNVTEEEGYCHSCQNNTRILDEALHVSDLSSFPLLYARDLTQ